MFGIACTLWLMCCNQAMCVVRGISAVRWYSEVHHSAASERMDMRW